MTSYPPSVLDPTWLRFVDDAAIFPPGNAPLHEATAAYGARRDAWYAGFVGSFVVVLGALQVAQDTGNGKPASPSRPADDAGEQGKQRGETTNARQSRSAGDAGQEAGTEWKI